MAAPKLLSLLSLLSLLLVALSFGPLHANALVADRAQVARHVHARNAVAGRKRDGSSSCQPKPTSSLDSSIPLPTSTPPPPPPPPSPSPTSVIAPPASPTTSATPSPVYTSTSTLPFNSAKKWILAWSTDRTYLPYFIRPKVGFVYDWTESPPDGSPYGIVSMPMLWGYTNEAAFQNTVVNGPDVNGGIALGPNEPNEPSQSNMSPQNAITLWMTYMMPLKAKGYTLVSPACTDDQSGLDWYTQFFSICDSTPGCQVDVVAFHSYVTDANHLIDYANWLYGNYSRPVMITEFADQDYSGGSQATMDQVWAYASAVINFVETTAWLVGAGPFGISWPMIGGVNPNNALLDPNTNYPTALAYTYLG